jgi:hypothetical protein
MHNKKNVRVRVRDTSQIMLHHAYRLKKEKVAVKN